jgi:uncharacterized protein YceK
MPLRIFAMRYGYFGAIGAMVVLLPIASRAAPVETLLHIFVGGTGGAEAYAGLMMDSTGALYGTTEYGGGKCPNVTSFGCGTVFKLAPPVSGKKAWTTSFLHLFNSTGGAYPAAGLIRDSTGALYGSTVDGGGPCDVLALGCGTVFKLTPPVSGKTVWTWSLLYGFKGGKDGAGPYGNLIREPGGALYGTTAYGGSCGASSLGCGTVFKLTPPAKGATTWTESLLYTFKGGTDGANPFAGVTMGSDGILFGTTGYGGNARGTIYRLRPPANGKKAWTESVLYGFQGGTDGNLPYAGLTVIDGSLYGSTYYGGNGACSSAVYSGCGTVFKLTQPAKSKTMWTESVLYSFHGGSDGAFPVGGVIYSHGAFYGTTSSGGAGACPELNYAGCGVVFSLKFPAKGQTTWTENSLYSFKGGADGAFPYAGLTSDRSGNLYGTTVDGGSKDVGIVFELTP